MGKRLAAIRTGEVEPPPEAMRTAVRDVIRHCLYAVDVNPMAVELCKVNLWLEALEPGKPLTFLDSHIKCGNSLIGVTPGLDISEIPDEAFTPVTGDHKPTATALKKRNKAERAGQLPLMLTVLRTPEDLARWAAERARQVDAMPEDTVEQVRAKQAIYAGYVGSEEYRARKLEYDLWTAAFFWKIEAGGKTDVSNVAPTHGELLRLRRGEQLSADLPRAVRAVAERVQFFHWALEFPEVFAAGGFRCVLGNPPWERIKLQEEEFFATRDPQIATAANKAARQKLIDALPKHNPELADEFDKAEHAAEAQSKFAHASGRFPLTAVGDVNTYALFAELSRQLICQAGRVGIIVPTGIATDDTTKDFFADLTDKHALASLYDFENRDALFPGVHRSYKFCTLTLSGDPVAQGQFIFFATQVEHLRDPRRRFALTPGDISLVNPNTRTMPVFRTRADAELTSKIYQRVPVLENKRAGGNPWSVSFLRMFDMSNDSGLFVTEPHVGCVRLYEGKMVQAFDHRAAGVVTVVENLKRPGQPVETSLAEHRNPDFLPKPQYWVAENAVRERVPKDTPNWLIGFKSVTSPTNERTFIGTLLPFCGVGNSMPIILANYRNANLAACFLANINGIAFDFVAKQKVGGVNLNFFIVEQLPILLPEAYATADIDFIAPRVLELVFTAHDLKPFADNMGYHGHPFRWDEDRRALLRAELDAYYAKLYGLTRDELRYILDPKDVYGPDFPGETFRVLKEKEERLYGEYRTRRLVLEAWDKSDKGD